jgi:hypothetical protein
MRAAWIPCACVLLLRGSPQQTSDQEKHSDLFSRDQPPCFGVVPWAGSILVRTSPPCLLDSQSGTTTVLELPEGDHLLAVAQQGAAPLALCRTRDHRLLLLEKDEHGWKDRRMPASKFDDEEPAVALAADPTLVVALTSTNLHRFEDGEWATIAARRIGHEREGILEPLPRRSFLQGRRLFLGYDDGEWGGDLTALDVDTGRMLEVESGMEGDRDEPVRCLRSDRHGNLWCVRGLAHGPGLCGALFRLDGARWTLIASSDNAGEDDPDERGGDWDQATTEFNAVAFDEQDSAYLLTGTLGLLKRCSGGGWSRLTPDWPNFQGADGLIVQGGLAVMGIGDSGVLILRLDDGSLRRATLPR